MPTYCTDLDVLHFDPLAATYLPDSDSASFERIRENAYAEIGRRLARRDPPVSQSSVGGVAGLDHAERLWVLYRLYYDAAAKVGDTDTLKKRSDDYLALFDTEMENVRIPIGDDDGDGMQTISSVNSVQVWRR
jgi:hypothetical protein